MHVRDAANIPLKAVYIGIDELLASLLTQAHKLTKIRFRLEGIACVRRYSVNETLFGHLHREVQLGIQIVPIPAHVRYRQSIRLTPP